MIERVKGSIEPAFSGAASLKKWKHARFGEASFDGLDWVCEIHLTAFQAFEGCKKGMARLAFESPDGGEPRSAAVELAEKIIDNQQDLLSDALRSLWCDFNGQLSGSKMWWSGHLDRVRQGLRKHSQLKGEDDLRLLMRPYLLRIDQLPRRRKTRLGEFRFRAEFEEEHSVGVLTDGKSIVGLGYGASCEPFQVNPRKK